MIPRLQIDKPPLLLLLLLLLLLSSEPSLKRARTIDGPHIVDWNSYEAVCNAEEVTDTDADDVVRCFIEATLKHSQCLVLITTVGEGRRHND